MPKWPDKNVSKVSTGTREMLIFVNISSRQAFCLVFTFNSFQQNHKYIGLSVLIIKFNVKIISNEYTT